MYQLKRIEALEGPAATPRPVVNRASSDDDIGGARRPCRQLNSPGLRADRCAAQPSRRTTEPKDVAKIGRASLSPT